MPREKNQKIKIVKILDLIRLARGRENALTTNQMIGILNSYDISCDRRTLADNILELEEYVNENPEYDFIIVDEKSAGDHNVKKYYSIPKPDSSKVQFSVKDLENLVNGVKALGMTECMPDEETKSLCEKIIAFSPEDSRERLREYAEDNSPVLDTVDAKMLIDAINSFSFLRKKSAKSLINTIINLSDSEDREKLKTEEANQTETMNPDTGITPYEMDSISRAVDEGKRLSFRYFNIDKNHKKAYKYDGEPITVEPLKTKIDNHNYYLICYNENTEDHQKTYRTDKMDSVRLLEDQDISPEAKEHKEKTMERGHVFGMFSGPTENITFVFEEKLIGYISQEFGDEIVIEALGDNIYRASAKVQVSPPFFGWLFQFGESIRIEAPDNVIKDYYDRLKKIKKMYK